MQIKNIFVTGGAGYVGAVLVPRLLDENCQVTVLDLMIYGEGVLPDHPRLKVIKGDIRNLALLKRALPGHDAVIHLACISNDPSFELNPDLGKSINLDAFRPLVEISRASGVERFVYASSSSVYGIKEEKDVHEETPLEPLTDYSQFKADCEKILNEYESPDFTTTTIRPATICGYSPRQRLDVVVNILTNLAYRKREITVFGGEQLRPNIHISDMVESIGIESAPPPVEKSISLESAPPPVVSKNEKTTNISSPMTTQKNSKKVKSLKDATETPIDYDMTVKITLDELDRSRMIDDIDNMLYDFEVFSSLEFSSDKEKNDAVVDNLTYEYPLY